jgi:hypothetical protein
MQAYCMKCRAKREMKNPRSIIQKHHHEESQAGYSRCMSCVRNQDVQNREGLRLLSYLAEPLKGWVSM